MNPDHSMLGVLKRLFTTKAPSSSAAAILLTQEETDQLIRILTTLHDALKLQLSAITDLSETLSDVKTISKIRNIQTRHIIIDDQLTDLISMTRPSNVGWIHSFVDAQCALELKISIINRNSRDVGWMAAARSGWPYIAETYEWMEPLALQLQNELRQSSEKKASSQMGGQGNTQVDVLPAASDSPRVHFKNRVAVREYEKENPATKVGISEPYFTGLTDKENRMKK